jgi:hypothetical protein
VLLLGQQPREQLLTLKVVHLCSRCPRLWISAPSPLLLSATLPAFGGRLDPVVVRIY